MTPDQCFKPFRQAETWDHETWAPTAWVDCRCARPAGHSGDCDGPIVGSIYDVPILHDRRCDGCGATGYSTLVVGVKHLCLVCAGA